MVWNQRQNKHSLLNFDNKDDPFEGSKIILDSARGDQIICTMESDERVSWGGVWKLSTDATWYPRRLVAGTEHLFILSSNDDRSRPFVVDKIPMRHIKFAQRIFCEPIEEIPETFHEVMPEKYDVNGSPENPRGTFRNVLALALRNFLHGPEEQNTRVMASFHFNFAFRFAVNVGPDGNDSLWDPPSEGLRPRSGKVKWYFFSTGSLSKVFSASEHGERWLKVLSSAPEAARVAHRKRKQFLRWQLRLRRVYDNRIVQLFIILAITGNFIVSLAHVQAVPASSCRAQPRVGDNAQPLPPAPAPDPSQMQIELWDNLEIFFTLIFLLELIVNFCANAVTLFVQNQWNWFDSVVVLASVVLLFVSSVGNGSVKALRILRVFRVIRVFGRIGQLREIVGSINRALVPALKALVIAVMIIAIYAAAGQAYFNDRADSFCDFYHSLLTLFALVAYNQETGIEAFSPDGEVRYGEVVYIYSFVGIVMFVLMQVVVAVMLESFYRARQQFRRELARQAALKAREGSARDTDAPLLYPAPSSGGSGSSGLATIGTPIKSGSGEWSVDAARGGSDEGGEVDELPLDRLLEALATTFDSAKSLRRRLGVLFERLNVDRNRALLRAALVEQLGAMGLALGRSGFNDLTEGFRLCGLHGEMTREQFVQAMLRQLKAYAQRRLADSLHLEDLGVDMSALLSTVKFTMLEIEQAQREVRGLRDNARELREELRGLANEVSDSLDRLFEAAAAAQTISEDGDGCTAAAAAAAAAAAVVSSTGIQGQPTENAADGDDVQPGGGGACDGDLGTGGGSSSRNNLSRTNSGGGCGGGVWRDQGGGGPELGEGAADGQNSSSADGDGEQKSEPGSRQAKVGSSGIGGAAVEVDGGAFGQGTGLAAPAVFDIRSSCDSRRGGASAADTTLRAINDRHNPRTSGADGAGVDSDRGGSNSGGVVGDAVGNPAHAVFFTSTSTASLPLPLPRVGQGLPQHNSIAAAAVALVPAPPPAPARALHAGDGSSSTQNGELGSSCIRVGSGRPNERSSPSHLDSQNSAPSRPAGVAVEGFLMLKAAAAEAVEAAAAAEAAASSTSATSATSSSPWLDPAAGTAAGRVSTDMKGGTSPPPNLADVLAAALAASAHRDEEASQAAAGAPPPATPAVWSGGMMNGGHGGGRWSLERASTATLAEGGEGSDKNMKPQARWVELMCAFAPV